MACSYGVVYPLWSFADDRGAALERIIDETGIDHVSIPLVGGIVDEFRVEPSGGPHYFFSSGGWHYEFDRKRYESLALKPRAADWLGKRRVLADFLEFAAKKRVSTAFALDVRLGIWTRSEPVRPPQRNFLDEPVEGKGPCQLHADMLDLTQGVLTELAAFGPKFLTVAPWPIDETDGLTYYRMSQVAPIVTHGLAACFCSSCRALAARADRSLDLSVTIEMLRDELSRFARGERTATDRSDVIAKNLAEYQRLRVEAYQSICTAMHQRCAPTQTRVAVEEIGSAVATARLCGSDVPDLEIHEYEGEDAETTLRALQFVGARGWAFSIHVGNGTPGEAAPLVSFVSRLAEFSPVSIDFVDVDCAPRRVVGWIKQAMRFARRSESL